VHDVKLLSVLWFGIRGQFGHRTTPGTRAREIACRKMLEVEVRKGTIPMRQAVLTCEAPGVCAGFSCARQPQSSRAPVAYSQEEGFRRLGGRASCHQRDGRANGSEVNPRGQGLRGYGSAAHGLPACESRDAGRAPQCRFD